MALPMALCSWGDSPVGVSSQPGGGRRGECATDLVEVEGIEHDMQDHMVQGVPMHTPLAKEKTGKEVALKCVPTPFLDQYDQSKSPARAPSGGVPVPEGGNCHTCPW